MKINPISINFNYSCKPKPSGYSGRFVLPEMKCDSVSFTGKNAIEKKVIMLLGAPNSGKGTYAREISKRLGIPQISTGDILRNEVKKASELGLEAQSYMNSGKLVPDELILKIFQRRISQDDCKNGFILDGFPRTINQAEQLNELLKKDSSIRLNIINLDVDKDILYARSAKRYVCDECSKTVSIEKFNDTTSKCECGGNFTKRPDDTPEVLTKRLESYTEQTEPLINFYGDKVVNIDVHGKDAPMLETLERVLNVIKE